MPIGIIVWLVLIAIIVILSCPGFLTAFFVSVLVVVVGGYLLYWIGKGLLYLIGGLLAFIINIFKPGFLDKEETEEVPVNTNVKTWSNIVGKSDREKAIVEWERKWGRKHPSRMADEEKRKFFNLLSIISSHKYIQETVFTQK